MCVWLCVRAGEVALFLPYKQQQIEGKKNDLTDLSDSCCTILELPRHRNMSKLEKRQHLKIQETAVTALQPVEASWWD